MRGASASEMRDTVPVTTSYDAYGRLTGYTRTGLSNFAMLYSGSDERVQVTVGATPRRFVYDESGRAIGEYGNTGVVNAEHIWLMPDSDEGGWEPLALAGPTTLSWVHGDHLGVPVVITNNLGTSINDMQDEPFGRRYRTASGSQPRTSLAFPGQIIDIADRHYNMYRDYDPTLGRYLQADPIGLGGGDNVYGYVNGNPIIQIDPKGLKVQICRRPVNFSFVPAKIAKYLPEHHWIKTASREAGMGGACGMAGQQCSDSPGVRTVVRDHRGQSQTAGAECQEQQNVDETCVNGLLAIGTPTGRWQPMNQCQSFAYAVVAKCRYGPQIGPIMPPRRINPNSPVQYTPIPGK